MIRRAYDDGRRAAFAKFALGPPTQVDQFVADVEQGQDIPPRSAPAAPVLPQDPSMALGAPDGMMPSIPPPPMDLGSTIQ